MATLGDKGQILERVMITHLLKDEKEPDRVAGAVGFSVREEKFYVFKAKVTIALMGGAVHCVSGRGLRVKHLVDRGCLPLSPDRYITALVLQAGGELTQMDNTFVPPRFKDSYGPVGTFFLLFKTPATNGLGGPYVGAYQTSQPPGSHMLTRSQLRHL